MGKPDVLAGDDTTTLWTRKSTVARLENVSSDKQLTPNQRMNMLIDIWEATGMDLTMKNYAAVMATLKKMYIKVTAT